MSDDDRSEATRVETPTHTTTIIERRGGGGGLILGLIALVVVVVGAFFFLGEKSSQTVSVVGRPPCGSAGSQDACRL
ncbi:hypothetical protein [Sphingomonas koreensis]|uniref:hypothetical protein n=1 Tax=Sphingomonas koreensis TaxID=93064 RepID=UPI000F7E3BEA|nr:hypothetical protein [Sphingomonas koreensis]RSU92135.1 hypothetical protein CA256_16845 [Sphingomonas koreensis]